MVSFLPVSPPRPYTTRSPHPYAPHAQPISFFSILSPAQYWVRSTNHLKPCTFNTNSVSPQSSSSSSSSRSLSYNRTAAPSKASSPTDRELMFPLLIYSRLRLLTRLHEPSISSSISCFRKQFVHKMPAVQLAFFRFILRRMLFPFLTLCNTSSLFLHDRSKPNILKSHGEQIASNCKAISSSRSRNRVSCQDVTKAKPPRSVWRAHYV